MSEGKADKVQRDQLQRPLIVGLKYTQDLEIIEAVDFDFDQDKISFDRPRSLTPAETKLDGNDLTFKRAGLHPITETR